MLVSSCIVVSICIFVTQGIALQPSPTSEIELAIPFGDQTRGKRCLSISSDGKYILVCTRTGPIEITRPLVRGETVQVYRIHDQRLMISFDMQSHSPEFISHDAGNICMFHPYLPGNLLYVNEGTLYTISYIQAEIPDKVLAFQQLASYKRDASVVLSSSSTFKDGISGKCIYVTDKIKTGKCELMIGNISNSALTDHRCNWSAGEKGVIEFVQIDPSLRRIAIASRDSIDESTTLAMYQFDERSMQLRAKLTSHQKLEWTRVLRFSHDGKLIAAGGADGTVRIWRSGDKNGKEQFSVIASAYSVVDLAFIGSKHIACTTNDKSQAGNLKIYDYTSGTRIQNIGCDQSWLQTICYHADSQTLATVGSDDIVRLWSTRELLKLPEKK